MCLGQSAPAWLHVCRAPGRYRKNRALTPKAQGLLGNSSSQETLASFFLVALILCQQRRKWEQEEKQSLDLGLTNASVAVV